MDTIIFLVDDQPSKDSCVVTTASSMRGENMLIILMQWTEGRGILEFYLHEWQSYPVLQSTWSLSRSSEWFVRPTTWWRWGWEREVRTRPSLWWTLQWSPIPSHSIHVLWMLVWCEAAIYQVLFEHSIQWFGIFLPFQSTLFRSAPRAETGREYGSKRKKVFIQLILAT